MWRVSFRRLPVTGRRPAPASKLGARHPGRSPVRAPLACGRVASRHSTRWSPSRRATWTETSWKTRNAHRALARPGTGDLTKRAGVERHDLLVVARQVPPLRHDPDLQEMHRLERRRIELAVLDARAGAHDLHFARPDDRPRAEAVAVLQLSLEDPAEDLHVATVRAEPAIGSTRSSLMARSGPNPMWRGVDVVAEREGVPAVEPVEVRPAALRRGSYRQRGSSTSGVSPGSYHHRSRKVDTIVSRGGPRGRRTARVRSVPAPAL